MNLLIKFVENNLTRKDIYIINLYPRESLSYTSQFYYIWRKATASFKLRNICNEIVNGKYY